VSKKIITAPFDREMTPPRQNALFMPFIWLGSLLTVLPHSLKIKRVNMDGLKPPFIVFGNHQAFMDFIVTPLALFPHRANYVSELEGFECYGGKFYRQLGALGTRKFVNDMALIKNIGKVVKRGDIIVIYPEARYANAGTSTIIPDSVGKLCKMLGVPVVVLNMRGNYLRSPIWNLSVRRQVKLSATITRLFTPNELKETDVDTINSRIRSALAFDEYKYQYDNKMKITYPKRAEGLHNVLYKCPVCGKELATETKGACIACTGCKTKWEMNEYGRLVLKEKHINTSTYWSNLTDNIHIPDWYEWQRDEVIKRIDKAEYFFEGKVHIESLPNEYNFIDLGDGYLKHTKDGFYLTLTDYGEDTEKTMYFASSTLFSLHTEYDYRGKGQCITLSTTDNTYFIYPRCEGFNVTKLQFATEYLYQLSHIKNGV
jgi:hypothetical protein